MRLCIGHHALGGSGKDFDSRASGMRDRVSFARCRVFSRRRQVEEVTRGRGRREVEVLSPISPCTHP
jgi:hypothetical protein